MVFKMLVSKTVMVKWNGFIKKWYEDKGYVWTKQNDLFECKIEDVQINSTVKIEVNCDYCGETFYTEYRRLLNSKKVINKDCCSNRICMKEKSKEVNLKIYGVENYTQLDLHKESLRKRFQIPFVEVQNLCEKKNLKLLSNEIDYKNEKSRLFIICKNHEEYGKQETCFANIKKNKGCCNYGKGELCANSRKLDGQLVYNAFVNKGVIPKFISTDYRKNNQLLPFICPNHEDKGIQKTNYNTLLASPHKCKYCANEYTKECLREDKTKVFEYFKSKKLILENINEYENKDKPMKFRCMKHMDDIQQVSYGGLRNTKDPCLYCRIEKSLSKLNKTLRSSLSKWRKESLKYCNYKCIITNSLNYDIHHLYTFNNIILDVLNELNIEIKNKYSAEEFIKIKKKVIDFHNQNLGICLDKNLHILYHQLYGKDNNTIEQFNTFKEKYYNFEFDDLLEDKCKYKNIIKKN